MPCLRHHGYASASQIVSMPASSIARADASISSSGSMVSCITPMRNGTAIGLSLAPATASCTCGRARSSTCCTCWLTIGCSTRWPIEPTGPAIFTSAAHFIGVPAPSTSLSSNDVSMFSIAPTPWPLICSCGELGRALLGLVHVDLHLQAAEPERDLHVRRPALLVVHVEALDAGHRLRHRRRVVQHVARPPARGAANVRSP